MRSCGGQAPAGGRASAGRRRLWGGRAMWGDGHLQGFWEQSESSVGASVEEMEKEGLKKCLLCFKLHLMLCS